MRQERDEARRRVHELDLTVQAIEELSDGKPPGETLKAALAHLVAAAGCSRGSLIAQGPDQKLRLLAAIGMSSDPFVASPDGHVVVRERFMPLRAPSLAGAEQPPEVAAILQSLDPPAVALAMAPVRSGFGLHGIALFYLGPTDPLPAPASLGHLSLMSRALGAWFVVRRGQTQEAGGQAAHGALPEIERVMRLVERAAARGRARAAEGGPAPRQGRAHGRLDRPADVGARRCPNPPRSQTKHPELRSRALAVLAVS